MGSTPIQPSVGEEASGVLEDADLQATISRLALGILTVPIAHEAVPALTSSVPSAATADAPVTTGVMNPANASYTQADQTALAAAVLDIAGVCNELIADVAALVTEVTAQRVDIVAYQEAIQDLTDQLIAAGILS